MKKSLYSKILAAALLFSCIFLTSCNTGANSNSSFSLDELKNGDAFQYSKIEWGLSADEVTKLLPYDIEKDDSRGTAPDGYDFYKSKNQFTLDNQKGTASFEFQNGQLYIVKFDFTLDENYEKWFNTQVEALTKLYGEGEKNESENDIFTSIGYKWEEENTVLNAILITGERASASIGVFTK